MEDFIEIYFYGTFSSYEEDFGYARVYFNQTPITYEKIDDINAFKARYQIKSFEESYYFYNKTRVELWDMKKNKLLMKAIEIGFYKKEFDDNFRSKYLLWKTANGANLVYVMSFNTSGSMHRIFLTRK